MSCGQIPKMNRIEVGKHPVGQTSKKSESVETILFGKNVMWPDSQMERFQVDKNPGGQTPM